jgi:hypothetical protein
MQTRRQHIDYPPEVRFTRPATINGDPLTERDCLGCHEPRPRTEFRPLLPDHHDLVVDGVDLLCLFCRASWIARVEGRANGWWNPMIHSV